jgi:hypothetical protein
LECGFSAKFITRSRKQADEEAPPPAKMEMSKLRGEMDLDTILAASLL